MHLSPRSSFRARRLGPLLLFGVCTLCAPLWVQAQHAGDTSISRACLWNGDRGTWSALRLKPAQIERLSEIRARYPAVVEGQWRLEEEVPPERIPGQGSGPARNPEPAPTTGLQAELRAVLSPEQIKLWHQLCTPVARD